MSDISSFDPGLLQQAHQQNRQRTAQRPAQQTGDAEESSAPPPPKGYREVGDVERRAGVMNTAESPENIASLGRLDRALGSGQPLRGDVPRGYYLSLKV